MKFINQLRTSLIAGFGVLVIGTSSTALGQNGPPVKMPRAPDHDAKIFPGSMCQPYGGMLFTQSDDLLYGDGAVMAADMNGPRVWVDCPIVRDDATGTDGVDMVRVTVEDQDEVLNFDCYVRAYDKWGARVAQVSDSSTGTGHQILDLDLDQSAEYGTYTLWCTIPPNLSILWAYRVYEHQDGYNDMTDYDN